jgi:hypothetical protein
MPIFIQQETIHSVNKFESGIIKIIKLITYNTL